MGHSSTTIQPAFGKEPKWCAPSFSIPEDISSLLKKGKPGVEVNFSHISSWTVVITKQPRGS